jgi:hypothetical protein
VLDAQDKQAVPIKQQQALDYVGAVEEAMVGAFPFTVPADYANLPQLKVGGRGGPSIVKLACTMHSARWCRMPAAAAVAPPLPIFLSLPLLLLPSGACHG